MNAPGTNSKNTKMAAMKTLLSSLVLLPSLILFQAQVHAQRQPAIPLWPNGAPGAHGNTANDIPAITPYLPRKNAAGAAMIICPGGNYQLLATHEGAWYAEWLNQHGVTCFVLRYRLVTYGYHYPAEFQDVERAVRWVRAHANDYKIDPNRVGIIGSSSGGHLASLALTHFDSGDANASDSIDRESSRPDLGILCYPLIQASPQLNLLGPNPSPELVRYVSTELQVTPNTPPCFIWCCSGDKTVSPENSRMFAEALLRNHVQYDLHIYPNGRHGLGLGDKPPFAHPLPWANECLHWLKQYKYVKG